MGAGAYGRLTGTAAASPQRRAARKLLVELVNGNWMCEELRRRRTFESYCDAFAEGALFRPLEHKRARAPNADSGFLPRTTDFAAFEATLELKFSAVAARSDNKVDRSIAIAGDVNLTRKGVAEQRSKVHGVCANCFRADVARASARSGHRYEGIEHDRPDYRPVVRVGRELGFPAAEQLGRGDAPARA